MSAFHREVLLETIRVPARRLDAPKLNGVLPLEGVEKGSQQVSPFYGSFSYSIPLEVPSFRGLEPQVALSYSSEGRNGLPGVGWQLSGFGQIERVNAGGGTAAFDPSDTYLLDGQMLVACQAGSASPSCTSGGTHSTKVESFLKIRLDSASNTWTVWAKDGTRSIYTPIYTIPGYPSNSGRWPRRFINRDVSLLWRLHESRRTSIHGVQGDR